MSSGLPLHSRIIQVRMRFQPFVENVPHVARQSWCGHYFAPFAEDYKSPPIRSNSASASRDKPPSALTRSSARSTTCAGRASSSEREGTGEAVESQENLYVGRSVARMGPPQVPRSRHCGREFPRGRIGSASARHGCSVVGRKDQRQTHDRIGVPQTERAQDVGASRPGGNGAVILAGGW